MRARGQGRGPRRTQPVELTPNPRSGRQTRDPTRSAGSRPRSAGKRTSGACSRRSSNSAFTLFGVEWAGLWTHDDGPKALHLAAQRGLSPELLGAIADLPRGSSTAGMTAIHERRVTVLDGDLVGTIPALRTIYQKAGIRTVCFVPLVFREHALGLLVLYHRTDYPWSTEETELARAFGDHIAIAMQNARLAESTRTLADRLRAISDLAGRLNRIQESRASPKRSSPRRAGSSSTTRSASIGWTPKPGCASRSPSRGRSWASRTLPRRTSGSRSARA